MGKRLRMELGGMVDKFEQETRLNNYLYNTLLILECNLMRSFYKENDIFEDSMIIYLENKNSYYKIYDFLNMNLIKFFYILHLFNIIILIAFFLIKKFLLHS